MVRETFEDAEDMCSVAVGKASCNSALGFGLNDFRIAVRLPKQRQVGGLRDAHWLIAERAILYPWMEQRIRARGVFYAGLPTCGLAWRDFGGRAISLD